MNPNDPNVALIEKVAAVLGPLMDRLVIVGGCAAGLLITDPAQPPVRPTNDVDGVVEAASLLEYYAVERKFEAMGLPRDSSEGAPICRWRVAGVPFDLMPMSESVLGFSNPWYPLAVATARRITLPSEITIRLIAAPAFVATKLVAFESRGGRDFLASQDLEDIIAVVDGRAELFEELESADLALRGFVSTTMRTLLGARRFRDSISGHLPPDAASQARLPGLLELVERIASMK